MKLIVAKLLILAGLLAPWVTATAATSTGMPKILVAAQRLNHLDQLLIEKLKEKGYEVVLAGFTDIDKIDIKVDESRKPPGYGYTTTKEGTVKSDYGMGQFPAAAIREYSAFIFPTVSGVENLKLPVDEILKSGKLVVLGESVSIEEGEKRILGQPVFKDSTTKSYRISGAPQRISYTVYQSHGNRKKLPSEEENAKFVETQLLPKVLSGL